MTDKRDPTPIIGKWNREKNYQCRLCAFSSLDKLAFERHFAEFHPPFQVIDGGKADAPVTPAVTDKEK